MKRLFTLATACLLFALSAFAQNPRFYKDGLNKVNPAAPFLQPSGHTQIMYTPNNFAVKPPSGTITSIFFRNYYLDPYNTTSFDYLTITLLQTTDTAFGTGTFYTGGTQVLSSSYFPLNAASVSKDGWLEFALPTAFTYNNAQTLIVDIKYNSKTNMLNTWADSTATTNLKVCTSTSTTATTGTLSRQWNHFGINVTPTSTCTGPPTAGTATPSRPGGCGANNYVLDLVGNSTGTGQIYQWQTAATATGSYTNVGTASSSSTYTVMPTANAWYRAAVTCGSFTVYSAPTLLGANNYLPAGAYTINGAIPTGGTNYRSFNSAVDAMACGIGGPVIFNVAPNCDTFYEQVTIPQIANTSTINSIRINGNGNKLCYGFTPYANTSNYLIYPILKLDGVDHFLLDSLYLRNDDSNTYYNSTFWNQSTEIQILNDANDITIQHCYFDDRDTGYYGNDNAAIIVGNTYYNSSTAPSYCDTILIQNNTFMHGSISDWGGTAPNQSKGSRILNNVFLNDNSNSGYWGGNGWNYGLINIWGQDGALIEGNVLHGNHYYNIYAYSNCSNTKVSKNLIIDTAIYTVYNYSKWGIMVYGDGSTITNNVVDLKSNYSMYGILVELGGAVVSNNTIRLNGNSVSGYMSGLYAYSQAAGQNTVLKNNVVSITGSGTGTYVSALRLYTTTTVVSDNNDFHTPVGNSVIVGNTFYPTLASWQAASGQDMNSYALDPQFLSPATTDFHPTNMLLDNKGIPMTGITDDILGVGRNAITPDIGAYEFGILLCPVPTNLTASAITSNSATLSWTMPSGSNDYQYVLNQTSTNPTGAGTAISGNVYNASGLQPLTTYYFHVRTACTGLYSQWVTIPFTTLCTAPSAAITPAGPINLCNNTTTILSAPTGANLTYQWKRNGVNITGATAATYTASLAGSYTVLVSMSTCNTLTTSPVVINVLPAASITANGPTSFCQGGSVSMSGNTGSGYTYQWLQNGTLIGGAANSSYTATANGGYRVIVHNGTCADTSATINVTAIAYPSNVITPPGPAAFCDHQYLTLNAALNAVYSYQWYRNSAAIPGATTASYDATQGGSFYATISNSGCSVTTNSVSVTVNPLPVATADAVGNAVFCNTGSVNILANQGSGLTYQWLRNGAIIPGATGSSYVTVLDGMFSVVVSNGQCADTSSGVPVVFNSFPRPVITLNSGVLSTTLPFATYQWNRNGLIIPYATNRNYTPTRDGNYVCVVSDTSGCLGSSNVITINSLGVGNSGTAPGFVSIYPNPATDVVYISSDRATMVSLSAVDGREIVKQRNTGSINITSLPAGIYTIKVTGMDGSLLKIEKLVKRL